MPRGGSAAKVKGSAFERELALMLGGKRTPLSGASGGGDISLPSDSPWRWWSWEAKRRANLPAFIVAALMQAETDVAIGDPRKPAAAFREDGGRVIVAFYLADLIPWIEALVDVGTGGRIRRLASELETIALELRKAAR
jgi:hypothetical protein